MNAWVPLIKKEFLEDLLAMRGILLLVVTTVILSMFSILLVSNTELSLLDNAQAVYMMSGIVITMASLVAIIRGSDGFAGERDRKTLEILMLTPATGQELAFTKLMGILFSWLILLVLSIPYLWAIGNLGQNLWPCIKYLSIVGTLLVLIFGGLALILSARMKSFKNVLLVNLIVFLLSGSPILLGPSLRQTAVGQVIDLINPLANALNTLDSVVIDGQGITFQLLRLTLLIWYSFIVFWFLYKMTRNIEL
jgi:ABC-type transport system involved in multi-copper enzyme maturation permease subunit